MQSAILSHYDLSRLWTRTIGHNGERMVTCINLLYRQNEGGGYKALANIAFLRDVFRALDIPHHLWQQWIEHKTSPPRAVIVKLSMREMQGWILLDESILPHLSNLADHGVFDKELAEEKLMDWEDKAFEAQWQQFLAYLPEHIKVEFDHLSRSQRFQLTWDAYVHAKRRTRIEPVTTYTKAVIPVRMLAHEWLRYAKAKFPYRRRGPVPRIA